MARMTVAEAVHFNSQPRKEADLKLLIFGNHFIISIHSLARRLTPIRAADRSGATHFNSQPRKEADYLSQISLSAAAYFNSQPRKEADRLTYTCQ